MSAVTQLVDSYIQGVSTAPDKDLEPGFVKEARNAYPDVTYGMTKRPGTTIINAMGASSDLDNAYYFLYRYNDKEELYFGIIYNSTIRVVNIATGVDATVVDNSNGTYLNGTKEDFRYRQKKDDLVLVNKSIPTALLQTTVAGTVTGHVNTIADLPATPTTGAIYVIKGIVGSADDYAVIWDGTTWAETIEPGMIDSFDQHTMPHRLRRTSTNNFVFEAIPWVSRSTGVLSRPTVPSFVGQPINNLFYHKNRLGFVSQDNVILSQPLDFYNFWKLSALTQTDADPIDLTASSLQDVTLFAVQPLTQGLVLFSTREQFLMTAGTDGVLTPATAAIRSISTYEMYSKFDPLYVDDQVFFATDASSYTRVLSMQTRGDNESPQFNDIGKPVSNYIPSGINRAVSSNQNQFVAFYDNSKSSVYIYRFFKEEGLTELKSWFRWDFPGKVLGMFSEQDQIFTAISANGQVYLTISYFQTTTAIPTIKETIGSTHINPSLDYMQAPAQVTYDSATKLSTIVVATVDPSNVEWEPTVIERYDGSSFNGTFWKCTRVSDTTYTVNADLSNHNNLLFGFTYPYELKIPRTYFRVNGKADYTASLTISRMNFALGRTGFVDFEVRGAVAQPVTELGPLNFFSLDTFRSVYEVDSLNYYLSDTSPIVDERFFSIPIHRKNSDFEIRVSSDSPYPVSLLSMAWEGQYSPRFYQRT